MILSILFTLLFQEVHHAPQPLPWWAFYLMGYLGIAYHIGKNAIKLGATLDASVIYFKQSSLSIVLMLLAYNCVCLLWAFTDAFVFFGLNAGELNGMTITLGYMADSLLSDAVGAVQKKIRERGNPEEDHNAPTS